MRVTTIHHACVGVTDERTTLIVDPGTLCSAPLDGVDAVLVTHRHSDHLDPAALTAALDRGVPVCPPTRPTVSRPTRCCGQPGPAGRSASAPST